MQANGSWGVVRPLGDSALTEVTLERRCFDHQGTIYIEGQQPAEATRCIDVFLELSGCGGLCIPQTDFLDCALDPDHGCGPAARGPAAAP